MPPAYPLNVIDGETLSSVVNSNSPSSYFAPKQLALGSCLDSTAWQDDFFDLTITSPPYNVGLAYDQADDTSSYEDYLKFTETWVRNCYRWTKTGGRICMNIPLDKNKQGKCSVGADITTIAKAIGWNYQTTIIWNEGNISRNTAWGSWLSASAPSIIAPVELIVVFSKGVWKKPYRGTSNITKEEFMAWVKGVWAFNGESAKRIGHPAPFPRELPKRCIKLFSYVDDKVFDPFAGSGTTLIEAIDNQRYAYGMEIDSNYRSNALQRIDSTLNDNATPSSPKAKPRAVPSSQHSPTPACQKSLHKPSLYSPITKRTQTETSKIPKQQIGQKRNGVGLQASLLKTQAET